MLILGTDIGWRCKCAMLWCDLDFTFVLAIVTLSFENLVWAYLRNCKVQVVDTY